MSGGGLCFGYDLVPGQTGTRRIDEAEAAVVRRIVEEYAAGRSPRVIASRLNQEDVPGPSAGRGARLQSAATSPAAPASSTTSSISAGASGTGSALSRTR
jgi:hypothetical protein